VGLPHLQPATVDPLAKTAAHANQGLDSENRRARKRRNRNQPHRPKKQNLSPVTKTNLRETFLHSFKSKGGGLGASPATTTLRRTPLTCRSHPIHFAISLQCFVSRGWNGILRNGGFVSAYRKRRGKLASTHPFKEIVAELLPARE
jgi:hypothetical protein